MCAAYALGALEPEEQALFDEALSNGGEEYQKIFRESIGVSYFINTGVKKIAPSPLVKAKLLKKIQRGNRSTFSFSVIFEQLALTLGFGMPRFGLIVSLLLLVVVVEVGTYAYLLNHDIETMELQLSWYEYRLGDQLRRAKSSGIEESHEAFEILHSPSMEIITLRGQDINPQGYGKIILDAANNKAVMQAANLPVLTSEHDYQLWYFDGANNAVNAGVFTITEQDHRALKFLDIPLPDVKKQISAFAVTLEPKGGSLEPTGPTYLQGSITEKQ